jgi:putative transposase
MFHPPRKPIRLQPTDYRGTTISFLTICCEKKTPIFRDPIRAAIAVDALRRTSQSTSFLVHAFCIMPDHVHFLLEGTHANSNVMTFVAHWKQQTGYLLRGQVPEGFWQRRSYDHMLRSNEGVHAVAWYIWMNPVRRGLVADPSEYAFSGSFTVDWPVRNAPVREWIPPWKMKTDVAAEEGKRRVPNAPDGAAGMR